VDQVGFDAMRITPLPGAALGAALSCAPAGAQINAANELQPPAAFDSTADRAARSRALFAEAARSSPRRAA
jgi:hypothetical protein